MKVTVTVSCLLLLLALAAAPAQAVLLLSGAPGFLLGQVAEMLGGGEGSAARAWGSRL